LEESEKLMSAQIKGVLSPWSAAVAQVSGEVAKVQDSATGLAQQGPVLRGEVQKLLSGLCQDANTCLDNTVNQFRQRGMFLARKKFGQYKCSVQLRIPWTFQIN
jgi:hypothetical protein